MKAATKKNDRRRDAADVIRKIDLPQLVLDENFPLHKQSRGWAGNTCPNPNCGESSSESNKFSVFAGKDGRWRFNCFACGAYGDAGDFLALARQITLADALAVLDGTSRLAVVTNRPHHPVPSVDQGTKEKELECVREITAILKAEAHDDGARAYLKSRLLADKTIDMAVATGQLRMLPTNPEGCRRWLKKHVGETLLREAGLMKGNSQWPALAFKPILAIEPGGFGFECRVASFEYEGSKAIRYGRMKWPWYFSHKEKPESILVTEGFIDAISAWQSVSEADAYLGIPGVNGWAERWFAEIAKRSPQTTIMLGFDNDNPGEVARSYQPKDGREDPSLSAYLDTIGLRHTVLAPPDGNDWNEALKFSVWL